MGWTRLTPWIFTVLVAAGSAEARTKTDVVVMKNGDRYTCEIVSLSQGQLKVKTVNTTGAVQAFSQGGNVSLGGDLSVAAGPVGRTAEAGIESGRASRFGFGWVVAILGSAGMILILAGALTALITGDNLLKVLGFLEPVALVISVVVGAVAYLVGLLVSLVLIPILSAILQGWSRLSDVFDRLQGQRTPGGEVPVPAPVLGPEALAVLSGAKSVLTVVALALVVVAVLWAINAVIGRRQEKEDLVKDVERLGRAWLDRTRGRLAVHHDVHASRPRRNAKLQRKCHRTNWINPKYSALTTAVTCWWTQSGC